MMIHHLTFATVGRIPPFPDETCRRAAIRVLVRVAGHALVLFFVADDHVHVVLLCDRRQAGRLARAIQLSLQQVSGTALMPADIKPVLDRDHMQNLVPYLLTQLDHHGIAGNQATWDGSCFPDLVGARVIGPPWLRIRDALPRFRLRDAHIAIGLQPRSLEPWPVDRIATAGAARLVMASSAALGAPPQLADNEPRTVRARTCATRLARAGGIHTRDIAAALGITPRGVRASRSRAVADEEIRATRLWLALEDAARVLPELRDGPAKRGGRPSPA